MEWKSRMTELRNALAGVALRADVPMAECTTLRLGGPADLLAEPAGEEELALCLRTARELEVPVTVVGRGSNLLVRDGGIRGLVIRTLRMNALRREGCRIHAQGGATLYELARLAAVNGLAGLAAGLAFAAGIPGTVGGGVLMNAGAYGGELGQVTEEAAGLTLAGEPFRLSAAELAFGYRHSRLQQGDAVVTRALFALKEGDREAIEAEMAELNRRRAEKQPLSQPSAGSTFKRPEGHFAAALIDQCGLKGFTVGGAAVSAKHAGFLVNLGGTAADFETLMTEVRRIVREQTGVELEPEVRILGEKA